MHQGTFALKRAHWSSVKVATQLLKPLGVTPSRFDMLWLIARSGYGFVQKGLWRALGVSRMTVSVMVRAIEKLGWVIRTKPIGDRRTWWVSLTPMGQRVFEDAQTEGRDSGAMQLAMDCAMDPVCPHEGAFVAFTSFEATLRNLRDAFRDTAFLHYPWHPDD